MMGKKYPLDLQGVANDNDLQLCCIMISNIKQKRNIEIPLLLPGVRPVSNLFKFKKK